MSVYEGVYKSLLQGVSQQTPQEREDGQLGAQVNMLSDPVTGLRRRGGTKFTQAIPYRSAKSYIQLVELGGEHRAVIIDTTTGQVSVVHDISNPDSPRTDLQSDYFKANKGKASIRSTVIRDKMYVVNTEKIPTVLPTGNNAGKDPRKFGYFSIRASQFGQKFDVTISLGSYMKQISYTASTSDAAQATPEYVADVLGSRITTDPVSNAKFTVHRLGSTIGIEVNDKTGTDVLDVSSTNTGGYVYDSGVSRVTSKSELLGTLPAALDGYIMAVGNTTNSAYYKYSSTSKTWSETGAYAPTYSSLNTPTIIDLQDTTNIIAVSMQMSVRSAGDELNNPSPSFIGYGITGISAYQSRLVLLSGSYVCMSKTNDFTQFMRTTVTELLDDDAIEIASASLSSAQFEYAVAYNKDLVLISQEHQAVIPANNTVLTPKTAVMYPSTKIDLSLAVQPVIVGRTMYYTYQRGLDYYQVGEFIPNTYTEAQYYAQNLTDHLPLYAQGKCTTMSASTTNNMVVFCSDSTEVLVNQFLWRGEERPLMSFHKWVFPRKVMYAQFLREFLVLFMDDGNGGIVVGTLNVQLNQLDDKPVPYTDLYQYVQIQDGTGTLPTAFSSGTVQVQDTVATIYDSRTMRHKDVQYSTLGNTITCPYNGQIVLGIPYESTFTLTPPFIKDESGKVVAGTRTTIQQLRMTFKSTGSFNVKVTDTMGTAYDGEGDTALTWSEADLGYSWINSIGAVVIPCRTRLSSTECSVTTTGTTDMNLVSTEYVLRMANKRRRL